MNTSRREAWNNFDRWAGGLLVVLSVLGAFTSVLETKWTSGPASAVALVVLSLGYPAVEAVGAYGLWRADVWARPVAVTLLWLGVFGALVVLGGLVRSIILARAETPNLTVLAFGAAAAFVLLLRPAQRARWPAGQGRAVIMAFVAIVIALAARTTAAALLL